MVNYTLENNHLSISAKNSGAELTSIIKKSNNKQYLWNADPSYWKRHSPILFPIVGSLKNQSFVHEGNTYTMSQHGFARDLDFILEEKTDTSILFSLNSSNETKKAYPFDFKLEVGYELKDNTIIVTWKVINLDKNTMYFSIGAHPAFMCPIDETSKQTDCYLGFDTKNPIHYIMLNEQGLAKKQPIEEQNTLELEDGLFKITPSLFDHDALIIENNQSHKVSLLNSNKQPYVTVSFNAPLFGLWSPAGKNAPFICIEPWYGRCDATDFQGELKDREWGNVLESGKVFQASYSIKID